jgi:hypothetical protein
VCEHEVQDRSTQHNTWCVRNHSDRLERHHQSSSWMHDVSTPPPRVWCEHMPSHRHTRASVVHVDKSQSAAVATPARPIPSGLRRTKRRRGPSLFYAAYLGMLLHALPALDVYTHAVAVVPRRLQQSPVSSFRPTPVSHSSLSGSWSGCRWSVTTSVTTTSATSATTRRSGRRSGPCAHLQYNHKFIRDSSRAPRFQQASAPSPAGRSP